MSVPPLSGVSSFHWIGVITLISVCVGGGRFMMIRVKGGGKKVNDNKWGGGAILIIVIRVYGVN